METILLLEDDAANREAIGLILQLDGFAVEAAETPAQALHLCRILPSLDLLVTDIGLFLRFRKRKRRWRRCNTAAICRSYSFPASRWKRGS